MLTWLYELLGTMLSWFSQLFDGKYVFALFLYALLFKLLFLPFSIKQQKGQVAMMKLAPQIERIQQKYKGRTDEASMRKQQLELVELQQKEKANPLSGCLLMFLQLPIITCLYKVIQHPLSYICRLSASEVEQIKTIITEAGLTPALDEIGLVANIQILGADIFKGIDLTKLPDFTLFGTNLALKPNFLEPSFLCLIPVLAAAFTWLSSFLIRKWNKTSTGNKNGADNQMQSVVGAMDLAMPLMTLWMSSSFSGMLGIYWIYQSILGIVQFFILSKAFPLPKQS